MKCCESFFGRRLKFFYINVQWKKNRENSGEIWGGLDKVKGPTLLLTLYLLTH